MDIEISQRPKRDARWGAMVSADSPTEAVKSEQEDLEDFLKLARSRFQRAAEAEDEQRRDGLDDLEFRSGKQWPAEVSGSRLSDGRPCLTMNRLPQFIRQVTNEQRQQRPSVQINPVGSGADIDTAEVFQGIVRHIETQSDAEIAYDTGFEQCVTIGWGYWRLVLDFAPGTQDVEIYIKRVKNPFTVYFDPSSIEPDYSDARWAFAIEDLSLEEYKATYPDSEVAKLNDFASVGDQAPGWASKDTIRIADYFHIEEAERELLQLDNGDVIDADEYKNLPEPKPQIEQRSKKLDRRVIWSKINAVEVIQEKEWPGYWIPIVPVLGDDLDVNGKRYLAGIVRTAKDPQRMYNYWVSAATEAIALAPKAPFIGEEGSFEGHEGQWAAANQRNFAYLEYKRVSPDTPLPQRQVFEPPIQAMSRMILQADNDLKATTGIYDASLGQQGPEQSGKAVLARQKQGDVANLNFSDNLSRSIRHTGRLLLDLIPKIYDSPRIQRIIKPDQSVMHVAVFNSNSSSPHDAQEQLKDQMEKQSIQRLFDIGVGRYDVTVSVGPSYKSKREEAVQAMMALVQAYPQIMQIAGDLLTRNMDWPGAQEIADRLKKTLPPQVLDDGSMDPKAQVAQLQAQLNAMGQQHDMLVQQLNSASDVIKTKQTENQGKMAIEQMKIEAEIAVAEINAKAQSESERLQWERDIWTQLHGSAHELGMQATEHSHAQDLAKQQSATLNKQAKQKPNAKPQ